ncbi:MAG: diaminopimelate decarboxylase [Flavobacteriales bacterium]
MRKINAKHWWHSTKDYSISKSMMTEERISKLLELETPCYAYDLVHLRATAKLALNEAEKYGFHVHYAMKANGHERILETFSSMGFGADCVSGGEVRAALANGFKPEKIAFAGVGKTDSEIDFAIEQKIFSLNVESLEELQVINERAGALSEKVRVALRLNPDVNAKTHHYITTGLEENKFGISEWQFSELFELMEQCHNVDFTGLHFHIGSQIKDLEPFKNLCNRANELQRMFENHGYRFTHLNVGGGLGIDYDDPDNVENPDFSGYFKLFHDFLELKPGQELHFELGRSLVANCGDLIAKVVFVKKGRKTNFVILDAGMTELIRPALYQAYHRIENISRVESPASERYDVVGPICESSDCFGKAVYLPETQRGDVMAIRSAGAYGECMASGYNMRSLHASVVNE